jgi:Spy/CpxP family protein refolding chaperone
MKKFVIATMIAATATLAIAQVPGAGGFGGRHHARGAMLGRLAEKLNLTDAQKQQMKDIRTADRERNKQLYADARAKFQELRSLKENNDPRAAEVKAQLDAMRPQLQAARKATREAMLSVLTADQRAQLQALRQSHGMRGARAFARRGGFGAMQKLNLTDAQKSQMKQLREKQRQEFLSILTPEQRLQLEQAKGQRNQR